MTTSFSVTKVKVALECPRLFYLGHHFGGSMIFLPKGNSAQIGTRFHSLADRFAYLARTDKRFQAIMESKADSLEPEPVAHQMQGLFYELEFFPYLQKIIAVSPHKAVALQQTWQALTNLISYWAKLLVQNRQHCDAESVISKTLLSLSPAVKYEFPLPNGSKQLVQGRFDSLIYNFATHQLCIVEYKTYTSGDRSAQMVQAALYSYMLQEKVGVPISSTVHSVLPHWQELTFDWAEMSTTIFPIIPLKLQQMQSWSAWQQGAPNPPPPTVQTNLLCPICPQQKKCQTFFENTSTLVNLPSSSSQLPFKPESSKPFQQTSVKSIPSEKSEKSEKKDTKTQLSDLEADGIGQNLVEVLQSFGIKVDYLGAAIAPSFIRIKLKPHAGVKISALLNSANDLRVQLSLEAAPAIAPQTGYVSVDLPRRDRQVAKLTDYITKSSESGFVQPTIAIGIDIEGKLVEANLSDPNTCHFLVGGTTGSGKSEFLRAILFSLLLRHSPQHLKIALVDPKRVTFPEFSNLPWLHQSIVKDAEEVIKLMDNLIGEMDSRYLRFEQAQCIDILQYNQQQHALGKFLLPRIVCIFDEYADFMTEKNLRIELETSIKRLGAMARAAGIHLIIATQRPEAKVVTPIIRSNLPGRVALRTASAADSMIILGGKEAGAAQLLGKGDLLYQLGPSLLRLQSLYASTISLP